MWILKFHFPPAGRGGGGLIEAALLKQESSSPFDPSPEPEVPFLLVLHELLRRATSEVVDSEEDS